MLPCFQLHYIGVGKDRDLYTFCLSTGAGCTYHLDLRTLCDVALWPQYEPVFISPINANLHAEGQGEHWRVSLEDCNSYGTLVSNIRLPRGHQLELSDSDCLTFGPKGPVGASPPEFYFMFQLVRVRPQDFAAFTIPRAGGESGGGGGFWPMLPPQGAPQRPLNTFSPSPKATLILSSIGSLSKLQLQPLTFSRNRGGRQSLTFPVTLRESGATLPTPLPAPRNRRKSAHKVLAELEDERGTKESPPRIQAETKKKLRGMKTTVTPSGNRRGRPRKYLSSRIEAPPPIGGGEPCAAPSCQPPQEETVAWVQCDGCDAWFHIACAGCSYQAAQEADYRCSSCQT
ncbi:transcription factor 19 [Antechinus flavipes]|uniref:transcription factor 19 n=1 Tax=Antechinus flavipes TaxID=38775 RepID=UPI002236020B|nr:transcription factor 19 [Antechinus flavipes]